MRLKSRYYEAELAYLREQGREFAHVFPTTAGLLAERSEDPDVERLLEGFAFLASRIRERVDDGMPEFARQIGAILVPQLTRYIPSCAVIEFVPDVRALRTSTTVPRGAEVAGTAADGTRCRFQTTQSVDLLPLELVNVRTQKPSSRVEKLILQFRIPPQAVESLEQVPIRLYLHGDVPFATTLRTWFLRHCTELAVYEDDKCRGKVWGRREGPGFGDESRLLPQKALEHDAFAAIAELFSFPAKFAFVDLPPLGSHAAPEFELHCTFESPPELPRRVAREDIRLYCAPIVNLFSSVSDPVRFDPLKPEALVRAADRMPTEVELYDLLTVNGIQSGRRREYAPFSAYGALSQGQTPHDEVYYVTRRVPAITDNGTDLYISLMTPRDATPLAEPEVLSIDLLCSNRGAAATLGIGEINQTVRGSPVFAPCSNITVPTPPLYPHDDNELIWRLTAHLGMSRRGLEDPDALRRILRTYNIAGGFNPHQRRLVDLWIDAIGEIKVRKIVQHYRGAPVTGTKTTVVLDETNFGSIGEAVIFGEALSEMYARLVNVNSFNQLAIQMSPSLRDYKWPPRNGNLKLR